MAWRFKASKYKNAAPIVPKPEACVRDICVGSYQTYGNNITASAAFMAFNWDHAGSSLAVLPIDDCGRKSKTMPLLHAHSDTVTDMDFSPFHDGILATGSQDCLVKIWHIPESGLTESLSNSECTFSHKQRRVETVGFHPTADFLLHSSSYTTLTLWDLISQQEVFSNADHSEVIQSVSWKRDGTLLATTCKDKIVRILDPRIDTPCIKQANSHQSIKDSRVVWLGDQTKILTTGFDAARLRQVIIRDLRMFSETEKTLELDCSTGILIPLYDPDTGMLFLAGKGDTTIAYMEVTDKEPHLIEGIRHSGEQTKGACLVPKRALSVMQGEVNRILQLTSSSVIPIMYQVPRKTYRDFHADLYPDTPGFVTELYSAQWLQGKNTQVPKISLDPANRAGGEDPIKVHRGPLSELIKTVQQLTPQVTEKKPISTYIPKITSSIPKTEFIITNDSKQNKFDDIEMKKEKDNSDKSNNDHDHIIIDNKTASNNDDHELEDKFNVQNGSGNGNNGDSHVLPPKPLPRASRTGSICELQTPEAEVVVTATTITTNATTITTPTTTPTVVTATSVPKPRPRTTNYTPVVTSVNPNAPISGGYKPRLGPKPFTAPKLSESENNFSKVFSVPAAPGAPGAPGTPGTPDTTNGHEQPTTPNTENEPPKFPEVPENEPITPKTPTSDFEASTPIKGDDYKNGKSDSSLEEDVNSNDSGYKPKTPSTAERRKLFEVRTNSKEKEAEAETEAVDTTDDKVGNFERSSVQRNSIAERRKMYENRSQSVQEPSTNPNMEKVENKSPVMLRRKDSLKNRNKSVEDVIKEEPPAETRRKPIPQRQQSCDPQVKRKPDPVIVAPTPKRTSTVFGRVSKFRHLKGTPAHKSGHIENVRNISRQISGECDGFHANPERVAVPLSGAGGKIAVFEISKTGKLPDGVIPALVHGSNIMDFQWDPFDQQRLAVACDDGIIRLWSIPAGGLAEPTNTPTNELTAHSDKIYFIKFHHLAKDVLASGSYDMTIKIWDLTTLTEKYVLNGHTEQIFSFAWSPCGAFCSTVSKDAKIRVYKPRSGDQPIREGKGPVGTRGARIVWALDGNYIVVTGFDKVSERQIMVFKADSLNTPLNTVGLDVSPAILIPFYDEDSSTLFLTGRGDSTIYAFEIAEEAPFICPLSHHRCNSLHQGLSFLPKNVCDVASVEFAKAFRLTNNTIEPLSFTVPRIKSDLFQDDLFPPTKVTWKPTMSSAEWFNGKDKPATRISLKPDGMESLSGSNGAPTSTNTNTNSNTGSKVVAGSFEPAQKPFNRLGWNAEISGQVKSKQEEIQKSVSERMEINMKLEQDDMEGVDEKEWDE